MADVVTGWLPDHETLIRLFDSPTARWIGLLVACGVGASHALAPGHGKSITGAYLLGVRGRVRDALALGSIVAAMHTVSVILLALGWMMLAASPIGTRWLTSWMQVLAAVVVTAVGLNLLRRHREAQVVTALPGRTPALPGPAIRDTGADDWREDRHRRNLVRVRQEGHADVAAAEHVRGHRPHSHAPPPWIDPWSRRGLLTLGASGGLLPSPSAFLVLVGGLASGRVVDAMLLVVAFGVGMAATLSSVGVLTVLGRDLVVRTGRRAGGGFVQRYLPELAAAAVVALGFTYLVLSLPVALVA